MIAQLKAENFELKHKERDYNSLQNQVYDLEHRFKIVQEEKSRIDRDARDRDELHLQKHESLQTDSRVLRSTLEAKDAELRDIRANIASYKTLADEKNYEIERLKKDAAQFDVENASLLRQKRNAETDLALAHDTKSVAENESQRLLLENDQLAKKQADAETNLHATDLEIARLSRAIEAAELEYGREQREVTQAERDLDLARQGRKLNQAEADKQLVLNSRLQEEKEALALRTKDLDLQVLRANQKLDDALALLATREKELRDMRAGTAYADEKGYAVTEQLRKAQKENETLHILLGKYRDDVDYHKRLREEESLKKYQLSAEKKRLEREALSKSIEAQSAKRELERVQDKHEQILGEKDQLTDELDAMKQHANVLESQNVTVYFDVLHE